MTGAGDQRDSDLGDLANFVATGFGSGLSPVAPGTAGTVVAIPIGWLLLTLPGFMQGIALLAAAGIAIWSAGVAAGRLGAKDPGSVVVDEIAGYLVAVAWLPAGWPTLLAAFVLFRIFDIAKPPPCRWAEGLDGGVGIVADDLVAGFYSNVILQALCAAGLFSL